MRESHRDRLDGKRCGSGPTNCRVSGAVQFSKAGGRSERSVRSANRPDACHIMPAPLGAERTTDALALIMAQYLCGNPTWDGPRTMTAIRHIVSRSSQEVPGLYRDGQEKDRC